jgi:hypothetical protein
MRFYLAIAVLSAVSVFGQEKAKATNVPEIPFETVPNFLKLPTGLYLGEAMGVATNSKGHIFVFTRSANTRLFEFDQNGTYVRELGEGNYGFEFAHSVRVVPQDNVWAVDEGTNMVIKFNPGGRIVMVIGHRPDAVAGALATTNGPAPPAEKYTLARPTDVAWDPQGNIFVSDGYTNHRVVKYDKDGRFLKQVGSESRVPRPANSIRRTALRWMRRAMYTCRIAPTTACRFSTIIWSARPSTITSAIPGRFAFRRVRISICLLRTRTRMATLRGLGISPARFTRWSWTGPSSEGSVTRARSRAASRWFT